MNRAEIILNADFCVVTGVFSVRMFRGNGSIRCWEITSVKCQCNLTHLNSRNTSSDLKLWSFILKQTTYSKAGYSVETNQSHTEILNWPSVRKYRSTSIQRQFRVTVLFKVVYLASFLKIYIYSSQGGRSDIYIPFYITTELTWTNNLQQYFN